MSKVFNVLFLTLTIYFCLVLLTFFATVLGLFNIFYPALMFYASFITSFIVTRKSSNCTKQ